VSELKKKHAVAQIDYFVVNNYTLIHFYWPTNALNCIKLKG